MSTDLLPRISTGDYSRATASKGPPVSRDCPKCGCKTYQSHPKSSRLVALARDRICESCLTRYVPVTPVWCAPLYLIGGLLLTPLLGLGGFVALFALAGIFQMNQIPSDAQVPFIAVMIGSVAVAGAFSAAGLFGICAIVHGIRVLVFPGKY